MSSTSSSATSTSPRTRTTTNQATKRACDQCRYRKIKCDGQNPCSRCLRMEFICSYDKPQRKKGPLGRRIGEIRRQQEKALSIDSSDSSGSEIVSLDGSEAADMISYTGHHHHQQQHHHHHHQSQDLVLTSDARSGGINFTTSYLPPGLFSSPNIPPFLSDPLQYPWPSHINESALIPHVDTFFERLYATIPVFSRDRLLDQISSYEHRRNPQFGAMLLSLCAFALIQPVKTSEGGLYQERVAKARSLMIEVMKMRNDVDFGENPTLEATLTSFFLFACLFGSQQHNAARFRLQEAVTIGEMMGLHDPRTYAGLPPEEAERRLRTYWILAVTERAYAIQRRHGIGFRGHPARNMQAIRRIASVCRSSDPVQQNTEATTMLGLKRMIDLFDVIDEEVIDCWNERCRGGEGGCKTLTREKALTLHRDLVDAYGTDDGTRVVEVDTSMGMKYNENVPMEPKLKETQKADVYISQQWLRNRIWQLCLSHNLLSHDDEDPQLRLEFAVSIARTTLRICGGLTLSSMEVHGIGLAEKLYDIASSVAGLLSLFPWMDTTSAPFTDVNSWERLVDVRALSIRETLNQFLAIFAVFRGGQHPYLQPLMQVIASLPPSWNSEGTDTPVSSSDFTPTSSTFASETLDFIAV